MSAEQKYLIETVLKTAAFSTVPERIKLLNGLAAMFGESKEADQLHQITAHLSEAEQGLSNFTLQFEFKTLPTP